MGKKLSNFQYRCIGLHALGHESFLLIAAF